MAKRSASKSTSRASKPAKLRVRAKSAGKSITKARPAQAPRKPAQASRWPFLDAPNFAVLSLNRVFDKDSTTPIVMVIHETDGSWQFLDGGETSQADASVVALQTMVDHDPTLLEVSTLPRGWYAVRRSPDDPWWPAPNGQAIEEYYTTLVEPRPAD